MKEYKVGATIIQHPEYFLMHHRKPGINNGEIDKIGLYGGQFDEAQDETLQHTARRELFEESGLRFQTADFQPVEAVVVVSERDNEPVLTDADIFLLQLPIDVSFDRFKDSVPATRHDLKRARALGQLTTLAAEALGKNGVI